MKRPRKRRKRNGKERKRISRGGFTAASHSQTAATQPRTGAKDCGDPNGVPQSWKRNCGDPPPPPATPPGLRRFDPSGVETETGLPPVPDSRILGPQDCGDPRPQPRRGCAGSTPPGSEQERGCRRCVFPGFSDPRIAAPLRGYRNPSLRSEATSWPAMSWFTTTSHSQTAAAQPRYGAKDCGDPNGVPKSWKMHCGDPNGVPKSWKCGDPNGVPKSWKCGDTPPAPTATPPGLRPATSRFHHFQM